MPRAYHYLSIIMNINELLSFDNILDLYGVNPLVAQLFCHKLDLLENCRFLVHVSTACSTLTDVSGHVTILATPISELKPLNCCDLGFFGQTLTFIQAC